MVVLDHITLNGVMQGPGRPEEDTRDGVRGSVRSAASIGRVVIRMAGEGADLWSARPGT